jgi:NAD(P)-dependent dehydrogenase (short-subunit alcohol dehydrogenase family)
MTTLTGKVAVVTGVGSALGRSSAMALAGAGAAVLCNNLSEGAAAETAEAICSAGGMARPFAGDVSRSEDVRGLIAEAERMFGGLDTMHANAGVERYEALERMADADLDRLLAVGLKGVLLCFREAIPLLRRRGGGLLLASSSVQATHSLPSCVVYAAAKARVVAAVRTLALKVGCDNIRVLSLSPGTTDTPMLRRGLADMNLGEAEGFLQRVRDTNAPGPHRHGRGDRPGGRLPGGSRVVLSYGPTSSSMVASPRSRGSRYRRGPRIDRPGLRRSTPSTRRPAPEREKGT